jgi:NAD(P)-dependent dehydrogenase (short-subunit alcohol dehydrogenase family)
MVFEDKKILIVGGAGGIGAAIAGQLATMGAQVAIADLSISGLEETRRHIANAGAAVQTCPVDLADTRSVADMARWCHETIGVPDMVLVTVIEYPSTFSGLDDWAVDDWQKAFEINFFGYIRILESFLPGMRKRGSGAMVLTASTVTLLPDPSAAVLLRYKAVKHAIFGLSHALAVALEGSGVRSVSFCPAMTATPNAIDNLRRSGLPGIEDVLAAAATPDDVAALFIKEMAADPFLICSHPTYREGIVEVASKQFDPLKYISAHFGSTN